MGRVFACSDLHGMMDLYKQIKTFLKPEDKVYFLGDAGDRGPNSWELIKAIYKDPQFIYMKGNHEDMLCNAIQDYLDYGCLDYEYYILLHNGGEQTFEGWLADECTESWFKKLKKLPTYLTYINNDGIKIHLSHAGFTPYFDENDEMLPPEEDDLIWDRNHFFDKWYLGTNEIMVHGHTPIPYLANKNDWEYGAYYYCGNHKICIDNASFQTKVTCLLDLNTFDEHIFQLN